ncbi:uncharacterized protein LOC123313930 [Coccinella septempunctata]|uniref:uncharacterized protein LOC123313930 n=1 Tax=Coccinella septempunctata TaxID=41139 RepID=UPI001D07FED5|nr:uncharacterized protein LOC123313930 [Coccinella septempunctata]
MITFWHICSINKKIREIVRQASTLIHHIVVQNFIRFQDIKFNRVFQKIHLVHQKKLRKLSSSQSVVKIGENHDWIYNTTNVTLPEEVGAILAMGPKFITPFNPDKVRFFSLLKDVECIIGERIPEVDREENRALCTNAITNFMNKSSFGRYERPIDGEIRRKLKSTKIFLKNNPEIMVTRADKGNRTVLLMNPEYLDKMIKLVQDADTYKLLKGDPTPSLQREANKIVLLLFKEGYISESEKNRLVKYNCIPPKLYGLCKKHKSGMPLRPMASCLDSPGYNIAKFIHEILNQLTPTFSHNIKNSEELIEKLKDISVPQDYCLVSFDVESLFTNIKQPLVEQLISDNWDNIQPFTQLDLNNFLELVKFSFRSGYVMFLDQFYEQVSGCSMGSPSSPKYADMVMDYVLCEVVRISGIDLLILCSYVDDVFAVIKKSSINRVLDVFNAIDPHLKFTCELEDEDSFSLPFLDESVNSRFS